jgi:hypothetical protein
LIGGILRGCPAIVHTGYEIKHILSFAAEVVKLRQKLQVTPFVVYVPQPALSFDKSILFLKT